MTNEQRSYLVRYLQEAYDDQHLHSLLAHTEDGQLNYASCCCFVGAATATHALQGHYLPKEGLVHLAEGRRLDIQINGSIFTNDGRWVGAEAAFKELAAYNDDPDDADRKRQQAILPLIREEITRREGVRLLLTRWQWKQLLEAVIA